MLTLTASVAGKIGIGDAAFYAVLGYLVVFLGLVLLMAAVAFVGKAMSAKKTPVPAAPAPAASAPAAPKPALPKAPGTAGEVKLYGTSDKDAAVIMAIVANRMGKPVNELRFISIKEVK